MLRVARFDVFEPFDQGSAIRNWRLRKKVEMLFAHLKLILKLNRIRLLGPSGAHDEFVLVATAQPLRKRAKLILAPSLRAEPPASPRADQSRSLIATVRELGPVQFTVRLVQQKWPGTDIHGLR
jgi:hypothetical protein